ncbi:queuosine 5'-phosphate N-glycosylase/hydrolase [Rhodnius prolixus]|uniref:Queuosine 5'-phosphate N-glycosylase/hydrolase n=2 Tax=Rhodnius TaxID=13248 RepID=R4G7U2_RHOPR
MALTPKESGAFISSKSKFVTIKEEGVKSLALKVYEELKLGKNIRLWSHKEHETFPRNLSENDAVNWIFLLDALNFCFWTKRDDEKFSVELKGKIYTGYFALCAALHKALSNGATLLNPKSFKNLRLEDVRKIFIGLNSKEIPLLNERLQCLHEIGEVLEQKYDGTFLNCLKKANKSAQELLKLVTTDFPCFYDSAYYCEKKVTFHKRAQILIGDLWCLNYGEGISTFTDIDTISMFADYRIPQALISFGALSYTDDLMEKLKNDIILENGCPEEVEIRGCSIEVVERLNQLVHEMMKANNESYTCNSILIDNYLWFYRREHADELDSIPYHKVLSIYY